FVSALLAGLFLAPAHAQETIATIKVNGTVMTSDGGEFVPASDGVAVELGDRVMVAENSSVTITYTDGRVETLTRPGVYTISRPEGLAASGTSASIAAGDNAVMLGIATAIWTAGLASTYLDENENLFNAPPISR